MTKRLDDSGISSNRAGLFKERSHCFEDAIHDANLFVERCKDISSIDTKPLSENYAHGKAVLYVRLRCGLPHGGQNHFAFLVAKDILKLGWPGHECVDESVAQREAVIQKRLNFDKAFPMLVGVSDLVNGPEGGISSRVWSLGTEEIPLLRSEFLFQSILPGHPRTWEFIGLPGIAIDTAEWEPYARHATIVVGDEGNGSFVQCGAKTKHEVNDIESYIDVDLFLAACDYMRKTRFSLSSEGVGIRFEEPIDVRFKLTKLALSTGDIFL